MAHAIGFRRDGEEPMSGYAKRLLGIILGTTIGFALIGLYIGLYLTNVPGSAAAAQTASGAQLYLATVASADLDHPRHDDRLRADRPLHRALPDQRARICGRRPDRIRRAVVPRHGCERRAGSSSARRSASR